MNLFEFNLALPITDPTWVFFLVLIIILFAPMILGRLHIPHIIGMILAGVLIGEHGFHVLDRDSSFELFGKVGLYYIMFLAGLEMDMEDFKKNRMKSVVFGLLTFLIPMALGIWSSMSMLGYGFLTAVLLASMYASHTLIAYPIISRYGLSRLRSVNITIVILPEEPASDAGEEEDNKETKEGYFRNEEHPEQTIDGAFKHSANNGKDDKGKSDRNGRTTDSNIDTAQTG